MSHQTGITANDELRRFLGQSKDGNIRVMKIIIENEELVLSTTSDELHGSWEEDYDQLILPLLDEKMPCYILFRFDSKNSAGYEWLFIAWAPDFSPVRHKMLYAATRSTMKSEFGGGQIKDELFGTVLSDVSLSGYHKHVHASLAPAPLTMAEEELQYIRQNEVNAHINVDTKSQTMQGVSFPLTSDAERALLSFKDGAINYVQLSLDLVKEVVVLGTTNTINASQLVSYIPTESARYHLFNFSHTHEGDSINNIGKSASQVASS
uniref:ADF-H domain-containing protein n=1 Tax=Arion vulgaris TaxID=1028688 RepID=A0A0B7BJ54_9EUPU